MTVIEGRREDPLVYPHEKEKKQEGPNMFTMSVSSLQRDRWKCAEVLQNKLSRPCEIDPALSLLIHEATPKRLIDEHESHQETYYINAG